MDHWDARLEMARRITELTHEKEQVEEHLDEALQALERVAKGQFNFFTCEVLYDPNEEDLGNLFATVRTILMQHGRLPLPSEESEG